MGKSANAGLAHHSSFAPLGGGGGFARRGLAGGRVPAQRAAAGSGGALVAAAGAAGCGFNHTNMSSRERSSAAAGFTSTSARDAAGSRLTSATVPTG